MSSSDTKPATRLRDPIGRALQVLRHMIEQPQSDFGVREIAKACGLQPGTVHRALTTLLEEGLVEQDLSTEEYRVSVELVRLGVKAAEKLQIRKATRPALETIAEAFNETVLLGIYNPRTQLMSRVDSVETRHPLRYFFELYQWTEVYRGASGLAILANLPAAEQDEILRQAEHDPLVVWEGKVAASAELAMIRDQGYALTRGRRITGSVGFAVPVFDHHDTVVGDIIVTIPEQRFDETIRRALIERVPPLAAEVSRSLGSLRHPALGGSHDT